MNHRVIRALKGQDHEFEDVRKFNEKFGFLSYHAPNFLTRRKLEERIRFLKEELKELEGAATLEEQADALIDLTYVAKGTGVMMGLPWTQLWDDVQGANMAKVRAETGRMKADVRKPDGWVPPQGAEILRLNGWDFGDTPWNEFDPRALRDDEENR